ncbi:hypothetical protein [Sphingomonas xinjiangensis]|uniref:Uncharacterized protein n=1 Tax=Sphingomonas xinjiangensis TaxID=643568 RepID=A0A840YRV3_9SPHN|nr:hypothetical protein [Sphingomonas xinjiangensis]MBB5712400.1 hypothetical protein [Sphingomonas xinjiangensis]
MHINETSKSNAINTRCFNRGRRQAAISETSQPVTPAIDTLRTYRPDEAGYWAAQQAGFSIIQRIEEALKSRDQWAGRYKGSFNAYSEEYEDITDCSGEYDDAHRYAEDLAADACLGNAYGIIVAQGRNDEVAQLIRTAHDREAEAATAETITD